MVLDGARPGGAGPLREGEAPESSIASAATTTPPLVRFVPNGPCTPCWSATIRHRRSFAQNNLITIGAWRALPASHAAVDLVGFDNFALADVLQPPVTVVAQDPVGLGRRRPAAVRPPRSSGR
jgi:hypothetical protein